MGKILIIFGAVLILLGLLFAYFPALSHLPGNIAIKGENYSFYFPIVTCIVISIILTILLNLFFR
jgi:uncharacterized membrane protein